MILVISHHKGLDWAISIEPANRLSHHSREGREQGVLWWWWWRPGCGWLASSGNGKVGTYYIFMNQIYGQVSTYSCRDKRGTQIV